MHKRVVLVTGSSSGLGEATLKLFAKNGDNVVLNYFNHEKEALRIKEEIEKNYNVKCLCIKCDVSNDEDVKNMHDLIIKEFKKIDVVVNNAGVAIDTEFDMKTKENYMKTMEINSYGVFNISKTFGNTMYNQKEGCIINISSTNGIDTYYEYSLDYDASKASVISLTHNIANHFCPYVRVNCVCPGWINTPMNKELSDEYKKEETDKILLNRFAEPEEIANLIYFLSSKEASYINDSIIRIDGGKKC